MRQQTLTGFEKYGKTTRRAKFLADMDRIIPWKELSAAVETVYPKGGDAGGRPPIPLERMLRIYFLQLWFNLSDPAMEEALYDSAAMRSFAGIDLGVEAAPDETTMCKFRHLLERNKLGKTLLPSPVCGPRLSTRSASSSGCSAFRRCATGGWRRTCIGWR